MNLLISENQEAAGKAVALEDLILTTDAPTTGGSRMLEGYLSLFDAEVVGKLKAGGYAVAGKANVGEFGFDLLGETSYFRACENAAGELTSAASELLAEGRVEAVVGLDVNGAQRRAAALSGGVCVKPTYGVVSRFGTIAVACSGETVCVAANKVAEAREALAALVGHDDKDGTSLPQARCEAALDASAQAAPKRKIALAAGFAAEADEDTRAAVSAFADFARGAGYEVVDIDDALLHAARPAWNVLMSAELCNNVSRFDGVKYGYRSASSETIDELYTNSRTEAFGDVLKTAVLYGSEMLSEENYDKMYDRSLRIRRVVVEELNRIFADCDALLLPACLRSAYAKADVEADKFLCFKENVCTALASIAGLPAVVVGGVQLVGPALSDAALLALAKQFETATDASEEVR